MKGNLTVEGNGTNVVKTLQDSEINALNESVMGVETSILIGTIAGMTLLLTCSILACWYIFFSKDKSFGSAKDQGLQMASKGKIPVENANKPTNHQKRFSMLGQYNQGAAN